MCVTFSLWLQTGATFERRGAHSSSFRPKQMLHKLVFIVSRGWPKAGNETPIYNKSTDAETWHQIVAFDFSFVVSSVVYNCSRNVNNLLTLSRDCYFTSEHTFNLVLNELSPVWLWLQLLQLLLPGSLWAPVPPTLHPAASVPLLVSSSRPRYTMLQHAMHDFTS